MALRLSSSRALSLSLNTASLFPSTKTLSAAQSWLQRSRLAIGVLRAASVPSIQLRLPNLLSDIWESILRAVPKKKTSHRKKRQRFLAGKALKDVLSLNKCSGCGATKRANTLCPYCVQEIKDMWAAHITDIFSIAPTSIGLVSASGASALKVHSTTDADFPVVQELEKAHRLGCHHVAASEDGNKLASAGFGGDVKLWSVKDGKFEDDGIQLEKSKAGEIWALSLSADGQYLASSSYDGRINVWDTLDGGKKIREYETKGSFGMSVDISSDGRFTASGHENGGVYIFSNDTGRLLHSVASLASPVRSVRFSPGCRLLAAAGDAHTIALFDVARGEQVALLGGHGAWVLALAWSATGEHLLSAGFDGRTKVWSVELRACVATHAETDKAVWAVAWLPRPAPGRSEMFAVAGANRSISLYREAAGG